MPSARRCFWAPRALDRGLLMDLVQKYGGEEAARALRQRDG